ncbi:MAG: LacI family DNA-binding transcriptional regulator [Victivallaceae bacterium]|nr:LacI family DNA-binding transcriptional regulator [Victivallaceae bacterium]
MAEFRKIRNLNDLAKRFGCTATTVSMALRNSPQLSETLREKIQAAAQADHFVPRNYTRREPAPKRPLKRYAHLGPILILHNDYFQEPNPARDQTMPEIFHRLNQFGVEYSYVDIADFRRNPGMIKEFSGVLYYNDQEITLPENMPIMQIFGWKKLLSCQDRITVDDIQIAELAADYFRHLGIRRAAMIWREDMLQFNQNHPRLTHFQATMEQYGIPVTPLIFSREDGGLVPQFRTYLEGGDDRVGFFAFNSVCGLALCCALEGLQLWSRYGEKHVLICDNDSLIRQFWPNPTIIDLDFKTLASRAVDGLLWRLENPDSPAVSIYQKVRLVRRSDASETNNF